MADFPHFVLKDTRQSVDYTSTTRGGTPKNSPPRPERKTHADQLLKSLEQAERKANASQASEPAREGLQFIPMVFDQSSDFALEIEQLENTSPGTRIVSAKERGGTKEFLVAVPNSEVSKFADKFRDYRDKETAKKQTPLNEKLASSIAEIDAAELDDYWTDACETLPPSDQSLWWEVWLDTATDAAAAKWFRDTAEKQKVNVSSQQVIFPDRVVILGYASFETWRNFPGLLNYLAELRKANIVAGEFTSLPPSGQAEFINNLIGRTTVASPSVGRVCILDTGVNRGHPLLEQSLSSEDAQTWDAEWGANDHDGHGTEMAGVCLYGSLRDSLYGDEQVDLNHRLESVKILPPQGTNDAPDYGPITVGSMALAEIVSPETNRVYCMAITAPGDDQWRPTLWSAAIDQAASGANDGVRRLIAISTGNIREDTGTNYPHENYVSSIEDPSQSWNALTVGAYTKLAWMQEKGLEGYSPIAKPGTLSPGSRTSMCWGDSAWPYKPDVVFEGGNYAIDSSGFITNADDLELLTTRSEARSDALLGTTRDTSAATTQAAHMAATLQAEYPAFWPETIRGLIVHSAEWTPQMLEEFPTSDRQNRVRVYGMGVPNMQRARRSTSGIATMVIEDSLQPYKYGSSKNESHEMHLHDLPMPKEVLEELGSTQVKMRVTLSYFIEPNPPRRGYVAQYQYASHGLRFRVRRPQETPTRMTQRLSRAMWPVGEDGKRRSPQTVTDDRNWELKETMATRGSIHSDYWSGTAAQLASSNLIAVFPVTGWWRYRRDQSEVEKQARYSLIVTISTDDSNVDLVTMISQEIENRVKAKTEIQTEVNS